MKKFILLASATLFLTACSSSITRNFTDIDKTSHQSSNAVKMLGMERTKVLGPVFWNSSDRCSQIDFFKYVSGQNKEIDALIDVSMEETTINDVGATTYSCKYAALAVAYEPIDPQEAKKWLDLMEPREESKAEEKPEVLEPSLEVKFLNKPAVDVTPAQAPEAQGSEIGASSNVPAGSEYVEEGETIPLHR